MAAIWFLWWFMPKGGEFQTPQPASAVRAVVSCFEAKKKNMKAEASSNTKNFYEACPLPLITMEIVKKPFQQQTRLTRYQNSELVT